MGQIKLSIKTVLENKELMDHYVGFNRKTRGVLDQLFIDKKEIEYEEISDTFLDFHPVYTHVSDGEYGNCLLVLYFSKISEEDPENDMASYNEIERRPTEILGYYCFQYKGAMVNEWFFGKLVTDVVVDVKPIF